MSDLCLGDWLAQRNPPVPDGFRASIRPGDATAPATVESLVVEARAALARVRVRDPRSRAGAYDLLAADGFATYACELALHCEDPDVALTAVLDGLLE